MSKLNIKGNSIWYYFKNNKVKCSNKNYVTIFDSIISKSNTKKISLTPEICK